MINYTLNTAIWHLLYRYFNAFFFLSFSSFIFPILLHRYVHCIQEIIQTTFLFYLKKERGGKIWKQICLYKKAFLSCDKKTHITIASQTEKDKDTNRAQGCKIRVLHSCENCCHPHPTTQQNKVSDLEFLRGIRVHGLLHYIQLSMRNYLKPVHDIWDGPVMISPHLYV